MELLQLRYFQALAKNGNLTRTAKELYLAPPSLSVSVSRLEKELGGPLFDRVGRRMYLNDQGKVFLKRVDEILAALDYAVAEVRDMKGQSEGNLSIASTSPNVFQTSFLAFMQAFPQYKLSHEWIKLGQGDLRELASKYDFVIAAPSDFPPQEELESRTLYDGDYAVLILPPDHPLADRKQVALTEMEGAPFVALSPEYSSRKFFDKVCGSIGFKPNIILECAYTVRCHMVQKGVGVSIATAYTKIQRHCENCAVVKIDPPFTTRTQTIYWDPTRYQKQVSKVFLEFMCNYFKDFSFDWNDEEE